MENLAPTGEIEGKRSRGGHRKKLLDSLASWLHKLRYTDGNDGLCVWDRENLVDSVASWLHKDTPPMEMMGCVCGTGMWLESNDLRRQQAWHTL